MLKIIKSMKDFPFVKVMEVYAQSNAATAREQFPGESEAQGLYRAEMEFYQYLRHDFFTMGDSFYALWMEKEKPVSAIRFERWKDGFLLEGLETHPDCRGLGYGTKLMNAVLCEIREPVYAHVRKDNWASLRVHEKCGFVRCQNTAMVDGSFDSRFLTLRKEKTHG
ncbi:MAG: GNAT family N-acetyltransferase [Alistipes sp.]|nr:GNAT family N-acetyltransferase [Alistipes sp.]